MFKTLFLLLFSLPLFAVAQDMDMGEMGSPQKQPFFTRIGHRAIYHLYISDTTVNYTGKGRSALAVNGSMPAKEIRPKYMCTIP
jgi:hypothetical protein